MRKKTLPMGSETPLISICTTRRDHGVLVLLLRMVNMVLHFIS